MDEDSTVGFCIKHSSNITRRMLFEKNCNNIGKSKRLRCQYFLLKGETSSNPNFKKKGRKIKNL